MAPGVGAQLEGEGDAGIDNIGDGSGGGDSLDSAVCKSGSWRLGEGDGERVESDSTAAGTRPYRLDAAREIEPRREAREDACSAASGGALKNSVL